MYPVTQFKLPSIYEALSDVVFDTTLAPISIDDSTTLDRSYSSTNSCNKKNYASPYLKNKKIRQKDIKKIQNIINNLLNRQEKAITSPTIKTIAECLHQAIPKYYPQDSALSSLTTKRICNLLRAAYPNKKQSIGSLISERVPLYAHRKKTPVKISFDAQQNSILKKIYSEEHENKVQDLEKLTMNVYNKILRDYKDIFEKNLQFNDFWGPKKIYNNFYNRTKGSSAHEKLNNWLKDPTSYKPFFKKGAKLIKN